MERKIIGIDFGHCETAAAIAKEVLGSANSYKAVPLYTNSPKVQVTDTQIILTDEQMRELKGHPRPDFQLLQQIGPFLAGDKLGYQKSSEHFLYFKVSPEHFDEVCAKSDTGKQCQITHGMVMACYIYAIVENLFVIDVNGLKAANRENCTLLIGCPATTSWTDERYKEMYAELIKTATGVADVQIIPESRAAMFSAVDDDKHNISAMNGAVVFDFGSSTADCTYMLLGRKILEFSWTLGASAIEREMTKAALRQVVGNASFIPNEVSMYNVINNMRGYKETFYTHQSRNTLPSEGYKQLCTFANYDNSQEFDSIITINEALMDQITRTTLINITCDSVTSKTGSWQELCRQFFETAKREITSAIYVTGFDSNGQPQTEKCTVDTVVLTGGASQMDFIEDICKEVFNEEGMTIVRNKTTPSFTVSTGLAWISIADSNVETCKKAAKKALLKNEKCSTATLKDKIANSLYDLLCPELINAAKTWANAPGDTLTAIDLKIRMEAAVTSTDFQNNLQSMCNREIVSWKGTLSNAICLAVNEQTQSLYSSKVAQNLMLPVNIWEDLDITLLPSSSLDITALLEKIDFIGTLNKLLTGALYMILFTIFASLLSFIPLLNIYVADKVASRITNIDSDPDCLEPIRQKQRRSIANNMPKTLKDKKTRDDILKKMMKELDNVTNDFDKIIDDLLDTAFKIVTLQHFALPQPND